LSNNVIKTEPSALTNVETINRVWNVIALNAKKEPVCEPQDVPNDDLPDTIKQIMFEGKATTIMVILK